MQSDVSLYNLQKDIDKKLSESGFPKDDKRFHPHLTVGRVRYIERGCALTSKFEELEVPEHNWKAERIFLMSSRLKPSGAEYSVIADIPFSKSLIEGEE